MEKSDFTKLTILDVLRNAVGRAPRSIAVKFADDRAYEVRELWEGALRIGRSLVDADMQPGDRIGIMIGNRIEFLTSWFGVFAMGGVPVPLNTSQRGAVLKHMLDLCGIRCMIIENQFVEPTCTTILEADSVDLVAVVGGASGISLNPKTLVDFETWEGSSDDIEPYASKPSDLATLMLTSGTTGPSKAIMFTHTTALIMSVQGSDVCDYQPEDVVYTCLPLFHGNALFCSYLPALMVGATPVIGNRFSAANFWQELAREKATKVSLLGTMHGILHRQPPSADDRAHVVKRAVVAPAPVGYYGDFEDRFGLQITQFYGLTDGNMITGVLPHQSAIARTKPASCGPVMKYWDVRIVDDKDEDVPVGEVGEMLIRPKVPFSTPLGYFKMPEETLALWRNLWIHTGDNFRQDADGWLYFLDRKKDALRRSGENISSFEVETVLRLFPGIVDAAVYAVPSTEGEDDVAAAIEVDSGWSGDFEALLSYCYGQLAYFAIPRYVRVVETLPRTQSQKVRKDVLRGEGIAPDAWDRGPGGRKALEVRLGVKS